MHLGRTGQRSRRKGGLEHVHAGHTVVQQAFDVAHNMHHVAVTLYAESFGHFHAADFGNATDVIARQVDQHHVLGSLFRIVDQFHLGRMVQLRAGAARPGAGQGPNGNFLPGLPVAYHLLLTHQNLGRRPHHMEVAKVVVIHVRTGIERAQGPVQTERRLGVALLDALAHLHLHEVAAGNQLLGALHRGNVIRLGKLPFGRMTLRRLDQRRADGTVELRLQLTQTLPGAGIGAGTGRVGVHDQVKFARQVVNHRQLLALQQQDVRTAQGVGRA